MPTYDFDLFTIGAGSGGVAASRRAASYGARVAVCESSRVGGTCVIRGCVPKKLLMYGGQYRDAFEDAPGYGWTVAAPAFDWPTLLERKNREIDRLNGIYLSMLEKSGVALMRGHGRIVDPHTVEVGGRRHTARHILVATGGHAVRPSIPGIDCSITSDEALELKELPKSLIIIGGGYIAVEFASIFNAMGVEITMLVRGEELLTGFDDDARVTLAQEMRKRGITIHARTQPARLEDGAGGVSVYATNGQVFCAQMVMAATGRRPNTHGLGLEEVGVSLDKLGGVRVDRQSRTAVESIHAVGDVTDRVALTPVAIAEGRAVAEGLFNRNLVSVNYDNIPTAVFSTPPVGSVGLTERQARVLARDEGGAVDIYRTSFRPMKHTLSGRDERVMMKLVVDRVSDRVLGCHMVGMDSPEIIQGLAIALNCGATKAQFDRTIALHPSTAEEFVLLREKVPDPEGEVV
ncbi:MAG TPA: glutathione-disulfide reductase [Azospirillaceae bacterium]|nr:glutathione-disulfide reductase [Azospirillaceae bacterium]